MSYNLSNREMEPDQEYHVNSGFVNNLRSRFAQLENNNTNKIVLSKRSASVENLLTDSSYSSSDYSSRFHNRHGSAGRLSNDDTTVNSPRSSNVILRKNPPQGYKRSDRANSYDDRKERPRSNDFVFKNVEKPPVPKQKGSDLSKSYNVIRSNKPPLPKKKEVVTKRIQRNSSTDYPAVPKIEHHDWTIAPDLEKVGREKDKIIIIESSTENEKREKNKKESAQTKRDNGEIEVVSLCANPIKDKQNNEDELPKPHTVSAFRSFFEKANKVPDTLRVWQGHSPTRKSSGSDITSPINSPRSPFEKVNDDNVFTNSQSVSQRKSSVDKSSVNKTSPRSSAAFVPDVDTTPTSREKSRQVFQNLKNASDSSDNKMTSTEYIPPVDIRKTKDLESTSSHTLTPLNSMSEVFDSKAMRREKSNKQKPIVLARKSKEFINHVSDNSVSKKSIPKDTIELKHAKSALNNLDSKKSSIKDQDVTHEEKSNLANQEVITSVSPNEDVLNESLVKPSKNSSKISPRQTKIFDSSNIVKKNKDRPKSPVSPVQLTFTNKPSESAVNDSKEKETQMEILPVRPNRSKKPQSNNLPSNGMTSLQTNIVKNDSKTHTETRSTKAYKPAPVFPQPKPVEEPVKSKEPSKSTEVDVSPVSGMSSFVASRLKKDNDKSQLKTNSVHLANGSSASPVPRKRPAPAKPPVENGIIAQSYDVEMKDKEQIPPALPKTPEPILPVSNIDEIIKRKKSKPQSSTKMVFDSSKIASKRKEFPKRKPPRKTLNELNENITFDSSPVPKLDLTCITGEKQETEYQEGYIPTVINPCNFKFIGECVRPAKNPYKKTKKPKVKISFDDHATTTFEYEGEESALENYLHEHPDERDDVKKEEEEVSVSTTSMDELLNDSPRAPEPDMSVMKTNTVIGASSEAFTSYKSKIQTQDFQFGMNMDSEIQAYNNREPEEQDEDSMQLLPADENDLDGFSSEVGKADMLF